MDYICDAPNPSKSQASDNIYGIRADPVTPSGLKNITP